MHVPLSATLSTARRPVRAGGRDRFDYVVVGAGSAGCVLAHRLAQDPDVTVLLLEAGGSHRHPHVTIPAAFAELFGTARDWAYQTEPEPQLHGRRLYWPRGRMLGGSSSMNAMIYMRGHRSDYDGWAAAGCHGWSYAEVLPYFRRAEDNERGADRWHGAGGPLPVSDLRSPNPLSRAFLEAALQQGHRHNPDFNAEGQEGFGLHQVVQRRGARSSGAHAYLADVRRHRNLTVRSRVHVTRLALDRGRVVGVEARAGSRHHFLRAEREVVLAAGAVGSPQLLQLSGIGDPRHLEAVGVQPVVELPAVGRHLHDHPAVPLIWYEAGQESIDDAKGARHLLEWGLRRTGKLTSNVAEAGGFVRTGPGPAPDLQLHFAPAFFYDHGRADAPARCFTIGPTLLQPKSRGRVVITTADPFTPPAIHGNYLDSAADLELLETGCALALDIAQSPALQRHTRGRCLPHDATQAGLRRHVREELQTLYHPTSTCAMGAHDDTVVDPELRVRGVEGLRVADASVMPAVTHGNTNAPTVMIAERASDLIAGLPPLTPDHVQ